WQIPNGAPHGDRTAGTRRRRPEYRARGPLRGVPRLDVTAGRQGARGHRLVFRGNPESDRRRWRLRWPRNRLGWLFIRSVRMMPSARPISVTTVEASMASYQDRELSVTTT